MAVVTGPKTCNKHLVFYLVEPLSQQKLDPLRVLSSEYKMPPICTQHFKRARAQINVSDIVNMCILFVLFLSSIFLL